ncbi:MAG: acyl-CoA dehydrogenase, partial [Bacillus sp. (in: firmicutes)]
MTNHTDKLIKGGSFLIEDVSYDRVFTPEDYTDEQKMIAKMTEDFVTNEVLPQVEHIENHEFDRSVK